MSSARRTVVGVMGVSAAVALAACGSSATSATSTTRRPTTTTAPRTTTTRPAATTTSTGAGTTTTAGTTRCPTAGLAAVIQGSSGAAGTIQVTLALTNRTATACVLGGYPGYLMLDASGNGLPTNVVRKGSYPFTQMAPTVVTLPPGGATYVNLGYSDVPTGNQGACPTSASLEITPPNATDHLTIPASLGPCGGGTLVTSPVFAASAATTQWTVAG